MKITKKRSNTAIKNSNIAKKISNTTNEKIEHCKYEKWGMQIKKPNTSNKKNRT